jgi:DNA-binding XRE family transcriptional regulator
MYNLLPNEKEVLVTLGKRLTLARLELNETQEVFGRRIGASRQKIGRMELGDPRIPIGDWIAVTGYLRRLSSWQGVMEAPVDLFDLLAKSQKGRKRATSTAFSDQDEEQP